ncbi:hypothetical protein G6F16_014160 [Rhizopus arrhizus]|nr:hypothetical protein G6F20_014067 [Rhizopus arrhizus]KAG0805861.1 hypothetical protein G6F18_014085 [Rhizopus arrhizus]KAG0848517.1 hypothetical protein G6F16_014160 [Rhizopus arrhizus]KAG0849044.1 hypothetical protein G6F15_014220 [Rhizopus arrhizus]KAG0873015.1 hypothetical protein G6F34_014079 [Rhizopus arrhizus]
MAEEGTLLTPTMENDPKGNSQVSTVEDQQRRIGDAILAHPILVPNDPKNETLNTTATDEHQQLDSGRMALTLGEKIGTTFSKTSFHAAYSIKRTSPHDASNMLKRG